MIRFGPAGRDDGFYQSGYKKAKEIAAYVAENGLNAFEYQCVRGVKVNEADLAALKAEAKNKDILLSVHAPYYISMSGVDPDKRLKSIDYIMQTAVAAKMMGADRVIFHSGSLSGQTREEALLLAKDTLLKTVEALKENGLYGEIYLCPETMGKVNQLGTLYEVLELCKLDEFVIPCIDFGHLNARTQGELKTAEDFEKIAKAVFDSKKDKIHCHFSMIEYTQGGEKRHLTFQDGETFGPDYRIMLDVFSKYGFDMRVISESAGSQTADSKKMKEYYEALR
ncbi:MAG: TIM barrel protein [Clostridia bacterium]|nr:TIM barrel protein [Clostridia bacterium]